MEANAKRFGLRTFKYVNNEPWHIQPIEIPASRNWRTQPWDLVRFPLPGDVVAPPPPPPPPPPQEDELKLTRVQCLDADAAFFGWATAHPDPIYTTVEWCNHRVDQIYGHHFDGPHGQRDTTYAWGLDNVTFVGDLDALNAAETRREWSEDDFRLVVAAV